MRDHRRPDTTHTSNATRSAARRRPSDGSFQTGLIVATLLHVGVFAFGPTWAVEVPRSVDSTSPEILALPDIDIPDAPERIESPAGPVAGASSPAADVEVWLPETIVEAPVPVVAPPTRTRPEGREGGLPFTPMTVPPKLRNPDEVRARMEAEYPPLLRDAGMGGTVVLHLHVDPEGQVIEARLGESSGKSAFDRAALRIADVFRFHPALNRDRTVAVWVAFPVVFTVRD